MTKNLALTGLLIIVAMIWGYTFPVMKDAVTEYPVCRFLALRFGLASIVMLPWVWRRATLATWRIGLPIGLVLAASYFTQTFGLRSTTATESGLITGLFVVFAPLTGLMLFKIKPPTAVWIAIGMALFGLYLLVGLGELTIGNLLTLMCAAGFGLHITMLGRWSPEHDASALATVQFTVVAVILAFCSLTEGPVQAPTPSVWQAVLITGLLATAFCFTAQTFAQQHLPAAHVAIILLMEPLFASLFGHLLHKDTLTIVQWSGAALILGGMLVSELTSLGQEKK